MPVELCREAACRLTIHAGWNTWLVVRSLEDGEEVDADELRVELRQLLGVTPLGLVSGVGTWFPRADASHVGIHVYLGRNGNVDDEALAKAQAEMATRSYGSVGIPPIEEPCASVRLAGELYTVALVDFWWSGGAVQVPWPATMWIRTPTLPGLAGARIPVACAQGADWMVAEAWPASGIRPEPKSRATEALEALGSGVQRMTAAAGAAAGAAAKGAAVHMGTMFALGALALVAAWKIRGRNG